MFFRGSPTLDVQVWGHTAWPRPVSHLARRACAVGFVDCHSHGYFMLAAESVCAVVVAEQRDLKRRLRAVCGLMRSHPGMPTPDGLASLSRFPSALCKAGHLGSESALERFLVPCLASASVSAAKAVDRLQQTKKQEAVLRQAVEQALRSAHSDPGADRAAPMRVFRVYCNQALDRLEDEELLLLPLARESLSGPQWCAIASTISQQTSAGSKTPAKQSSASLEETAPRNCPLWDCPPGDASALFRCRASSR